MAYHIVNARIVNDGTVTTGDLSVARGRILGVNVPAPPGAEVIDAAGGYLLPGMIDDQVHFREPGFEHKATIATESRAAVAGGITSYLEMPNCDPQTVTASALEDKHARAAARSMANYGFYLGATNDNLEAIKAVDRRLACGIKIFMGSSTGNMLVDDERTLDGIFAASPIVIATHCEHTPTIVANEAAARARYGDDIPFTEHPRIRSADACYRSSSLAVELATRYNARLHVLHITTARELDLFESGDLADKRITAEACVHHLFFNDTAYAAKGAAITCNPAIKSTADQQALWAAVNDDRIDVIATDHAPHTAEEKARLYAEAPAGLPLVQHALLTLFELVRAGTFRVETVVDKIAHAPARLFGIRDRGFIREGYWADLVLVDPTTPTSNGPIFSKCGWSPFSDIVFGSRVRMTWVNGELRYRDGDLQTGSGGRALEFERR
ncbi:MAG: dihydroorotase [Vicinamibacterales bacterium]|nr:dihydroorotase [Vicinamibacterales bacterium]